MLTRPVVARRLHLRGWLVVVGALIGAPAALAAPSATATIGTTSASAPYNYTITVTNTGLDPISIFWFAWTNTPYNYNFLPEAPTNVSSPNFYWYGYTTGPDSPGDGYGIEWVSYYPIQPGETLGGFNFTSTLAPSHLGDLASVYPVPISTSYVFSDTYYTNAGYGTALSPTVVPEPGMLAGAAGVLAWWGCGRRRRCGIRA